jgi:hypothetical protein
MCSSSFGRKPERNPLIGWSKPKGKESTMSMLNNWSAICGVGSCDSVLRSYRSFFNTVIIIKSTSLANCVDQDT